MGEGDSNGGSMLIEKFEISLTPGLVERLDEVVEFFDVSNWEELVEVAVRRLLDWFVVRAGSFLRKE